MKVLAAIAAAALVTLAMFISVRGGFTTGEQPPELARPSKAHQRGAMPSRGSRMADVLASARNRPQRSLRTWALGLDDEELARLTKDVVDLYVTETEVGAGETQKNLLCALAMEWGRRDLDGVLAMMDSWGGDDGEDLRLALQTPVRAAALAGSAEVDAAAAWKLMGDLLGEDPASRSMEETGFSYIVAEASDPHTQMAAEVIFRRWTQQDPQAAWEAASHWAEGIVTPGERRHAGIFRGLLATVDDPALRKEILASIQSTLAAQHASVTLGFDMEDFETDSSEPRAFFLLDEPPAASRRTAAALGLAERDPDFAWEWLGGSLSETLESRAEIASVVSFELADGVEAFAGNVKGVVDAGSVQEQFLKAWAVRDPAAAQQFFDQNLGDSEPGLHAALATGMLASDPEGAMDVLAAVGDAAVRMQALQQWLRGEKFVEGDLAWPILEDAVPAKTPAERRAVVAGALDRLGFDANQRAELRGLVN